jgi:hypothetical protein
MRTYAHELVYNSDGHITGGTLPALVERLTTHDSTPDSTFVSTFYFTFRLFTTPKEFAQALVDRFDYVDENPDVAAPVRLRVYNVFKGWLESYWKRDLDVDALPIIESFATDRLHAVLPSVGRRLEELAGKVKPARGPLVPRLLSSLSKTGACAMMLPPAASPLPAPVLSRSQLTALKAWKYGSGSMPGLMNLDPLELARQLTIRESRMFCAISPEELLGQAWTKPGLQAINVRAMAAFSTHLTNYVADTILSQMDVRKRAAVIKRWVKVATRCLELNNYASFFSIMCAVAASYILRLTKTWDVVPQKTKDKLAPLRVIVDVARNYSELRKRLQKAEPPCIPFLGMYQTDVSSVFSCPIPFCVYVCMCLRGSVGNGILDCAAANRCGSSCRSLYSSILATIRRACLATGRRRADR